MRLIVVAAVGWLGTLAALASFTANPTVISRAQLLQSDAVVIAQRVDPAHDRVKIERVLSGNLAVDSEIAVLNLNELTELTSAKSYVLPLTFFRHDYRVTKLEGQEVAPLVYPATPEYIDRVKQTLRDAK